MEKNAMYNNLIEGAAAARKNAHAPYSQLFVGAAILGGSGTMYTGCNIENSSYGMTVCAERVAVFNAVSQGERSFKVIAIVTDTEKPIPPCGACRQVLAEFNSNLTIIMATTTGIKTIQSLKELFPLPFTRDDLV
jgi:cytidine deaminase